MVFRYIRYLLFFVSIQLSAEAQNLGFVAVNSVNWDTTSATLTMNTFGHYGSTFLSGQMMNILRYGGFIDEDLKRETINRLNKGNQLGILGGEYRSSWEFSDPAARLLNKYGYYVTGEVGGLAGVYAARDLVPFMLNGNAQYVGDTAYFAPTEMASYSYQKIGIGINQNNRLKVGLSLMNFSQFSYGRIENGYIAVPDSFNQMSVTLRGGYVSQDTATRSFFNRAGIGLGIDMEVKIPLRPTDSISDQKTPHFVVGFKNLGAYFSNERTNNYTVRSNYTFNGFEVNSLQQFESSIFSLNSTIDSLRPAVSTGRMVEILPFELYFFMPTLSEGKRIQPVAGFRYINRSVLRAMAYLGAEWKSKNNQLFVSSYFTAGGFTRFQWGMSWRYDFASFQIGLVSNNLLGWFTEAALGRSVGVSLMYRFTR
jgi:hypothetical protein